MSLYQALRVWMLWMSLPTSVKTRVAELIKQWDNKHKADSKIVEMIDAPMVKSMIVVMLVSIVKTYNNPYVRINGFLDAIQMRMAKTNLSFTSLVLSTMSSFSAMEGFKMTPMLEDLLGKSDFSEQRRPSLNAAVCVIRALTIIALSPRVRDGLEAPKWASDLVHPLGSAPLLPRDERPKAVDIVRTMMGREKADAIKYNH
uniref:Uncharacterized protein n=1 Tax=viral metagenome TaxID=1070528 RepID=A0A2V0R9J2_9ZZZZ